MNEDLKILNDKIDYLTKLVETTIENFKPNKSKEHRTKDMLKILEASPLAKNPMFKQMIEPIKDILSKV